MTNQDPKTIFATFDSFALADGAATFLGAWEKGQPDIKFGTLSLICETPDGQLKLRHYGPRNTLQGAVAGVIFGTIVGRLLGAPSYLGMLVGTAIGAAAGTLIMQQPDLTPEEQANLIANLGEGRAGLVIRVTRGQVDQLTGEIAKLDGTVKEYNPLGERARSAPTVAAPVPA